MNFLQWVSKYVYLMAREFAEWLTEYLHRPVLVCAVLGALPFTPFLGAPIVALITLRRGPRDALLVCLSAAALIAVTFLLGSVPVVSYVGHLALNWIPPLGLAALLGRSGSLNLTVQVTIMLACVYIALWFGFSDPVADSKHYIDTVFLPFMEQLGVPINPALDFSQITWFMPGYRIASDSLGFLLSLFLARWLQQLVAQSGGFGAEFRGLRMGLVIGVVASFVFVIAGLTPYAVFDNLVVVLLVAFVMQGMSVAHTVLLINGWNVGILFVVYILLVIAPWMVMIMAGIGFTDNWLNLKAMAARGKNS